MDIKKDGKPGRFAALAPAPLLVTFYSVPVQVLARVWLGDRGSSCFCFAHPSPRSGVLFALSPRRPSALAFALALARNNTTCQSCCGAGGRAAPGQAARQAVGEAAALHNKGRCPAARTGVSPASLSQTGRGVSAAIPDSCSLSSLAHDGDGDAYAWNQRVHPSISRLPASLPRRRRRAV